MGRPFSPLRERGASRATRRSDEGLMDEHWLISIVKAVVVINLVLLAFAYTTLLERKLLGRMQLRYGPNQAGPFGLLQPIADLVKLVRKESFLPRTGVDALFVFSPVLAGFTALASFA